MNTKIKLQAPKGWSIKQIGDLLDFERPDNYIVESEIYSPQNKTPVLTANKSFVLGYTNEDFGIYKNIPAIIFDDFTTDSKFVDFPFKIKSSAIKILKSKEEDSDLRFVHELMKSINFQIANHKRHYISQYQYLEVAVPPVNEQKKIAEILSTVDLEIEKTDEIILQTEKLKNGLTQKLFTKGVNHKKFKSTKLGDIPEDWSVVSIKNAPLQLIDGDRGINYPKLSDFSSGGYCLFLNNKNIKDDHFVFSNMQFITREKDELLKKGKLERLDVVLTTRGTVGNVAFYDEKVTFENIRINSGMILLRACEELSSSFLYHLMKSPLMKKRYLGVASGSAQPQLPIRSLEQIYIPIPPEDEQEEIVNICKTLDVKVLENAQYKEYLTILKKGLMQDLLSGNKRVKI
ncbi:MAG: restriction endonuclease subunit S [Patescibacteria group bacterium]